MTESRLSVVPDEPITNPDGLSRASLVVERLCSEMEERTGRIEKLYGELLADLAEDAP